MLKVTPHITMAKSVFALYTRSSILKRGQFMFILVRFLFVLFLFSNAAQADWGEGQVIYEGEPSFTHEGNGGIVVTGASLTNAGSMLSPPSAKSSSSASLFHGRKQRSCGGTEKRTQRCPASTMGRVTAAAFHLTASLFATVSPV